MHVTVKWVAHHVQMREKGSTIGYIYETEMKLEKLENVRWRNTNIVLLLIFVDLVDSVLLFAELMLV